MKNRYIVTASYFVWADSDEEVKQIVERKVEAERNKYDNRYDVESIEENDFGSLYRRKVS